MRLKVCQIVPTLVRGGAEKQLTLLASNLDPQRFEPHVIVLTHSGPLEDELRARGVQVHVIGKRRQADPLAYVRLERKLRQLAPDIVHTWLFAANSYGRLAAHRAGVPVIIAGERCVDPWKSRWHLIVDRFLQKYTAKIATNTNAVTNFYRQRGLDAARFTVIPNAVTIPTETKLSHDDLFKRLRIPPRSFVVGAVGRLWKQKGYDDLVWAAELLRVAHGNVWVVIVGDGPEMERLQQLRDKYHGQDAVRFVGHRQDAAQLMSAFDVLWNGSLYEGQSNTILEAMARGIPVLASDIPGNRDLVVHGESGYLYPLGAPATLTKLTNNLLRDSEKLAAMGRFAQRRVAEDFSLERMLASHQQLYADLHRQATDPSAGHNS